MRSASLLAYGGIAAATVILDQIVKWIVVAEMELYEQIDILPVLALFHTRNTGIAFSMLSGVGGVGLTLISLGVIAAVLFLASQTKPEQRAARVGFALIVGGALGNIIDRAMLGYVVDYVLVHTATWSFAVFNLADSFITVGAALVLLDEALSWLRERQAKS